MKKILFMFLAFFSFGGVVLADVNIPPQYNTSITKDGKLQIVIEDSNGLKTSNIKFYRVDSNRKNDKSIGSESIKAEGASKFIYTFSKSIISARGIHYFHIVIKDNTGVLNDSYFHVKNTGGKFGRYFAPKLNDFNYSNGILKFNVEDSGGILSGVAYDLNNGGKEVYNLKNDKNFVKNKSTKLPMNISINNLKKGSDGSYYVKVETSDDTNYNKTVRTIKVAVAGVSGKNNSSSNNSSGTAKSNTSTSTSNKSSNGATSKSSSSSNAKSNTTTTPKSNTNSDVMKVLLIGNSYTYFNDYGAILAELGKKTGKKMIVVNAVHGGRDAYCLDDAVVGITIYYWKNFGTLNGKNCSTKTCVSTVFKNHDALTNSYNRKLTEAINGDWGNLGRAGKWDYVFLQNHYKGEMGTLMEKFGNKKSEPEILKYYCRLKKKGSRNEKTNKVSCGSASDCRKKYEKNDTDKQYTKYSNLSNVRIYNMVKKTIGDDTSKFVIMRTFATDWPSHTDKNNYMKKSAYENDFSFVDTRMIAKAISGSKTKDRLSTFTILDDSEHPSSRGAYLMATAAYARIYGRGNLARANNSSVFIPLYSTDGKFDRDEYSPAFLDSGKNSSAMKVDKAWARKIQETVYKYYKSYVKNCYDDDCSSGK